MEDEAELSPFRLADERARADLLVVEGEIALRRLLSSGAAPRTVLCTPAKQAALRELLPPETRIVVREAARLRALVGYGFHRGVLATAARPPVRSALPAELVARLAARGRSTLVLAERISDGSNLGALVRNAYALGADAVLADAAGADPWSRKAIRASAGTVFLLPTIVTHDLAAAAVGLRAALGARLAVALAAAPAGVRHPVVSVDAYQRPAHLLLALGSEGAGLSERLGACADDAITIRMQRHADSLNVAAASAVLLYALAPERVEPTKIG